MEKVTVVRYSASGEKFEILVKPDPALEYKSGKRQDVSSVLVSEEVYSDSNKGTRASSDKLEKIFKTTDTSQIIKIILDKGELNLTTEQRKRMVSEKRKQIVEYLSKSYVDPKSHLPHPPLRIEQAMDQARVSIDPFKPKVEQANEIIEKLRPIIPLKSENLLLDIVVPASYAAQSYSILKSLGDFKKEQWQSDGSLKVILDIPAAARAHVIDRLGSVTKGSAKIEVSK